MASRDLLRHLHCWRIVAAAKPSSGWRLFRVTNGFGSCVVGSSCWPFVKSNSQSLSRSARRSHQDPAAPGPEGCNGLPAGSRGSEHSLNGTKHLKEGESVCTYPVVEAVKVGVEALVVPPATVRDLGTDVPTVRCTEALLVVVPAERVLHRAAEACHVETVLMLLILHTAHTSVKQEIQMVVHVSPTWLHTWTWHWPEALVDGVFVLVAPVLQVYPEAVVALGAQVVYVVIAQPELWVQVTESVPVVPPAAVEAHWAIDPPLDHGPATTWGTKTRGGCFGINRDFPSVQVGDLQV